MNCPYCGKKLQTDYFDELNITQAWCPECDRFFQWEDVYDYVRTDYFETDCDYYVIRQMDEKEWDKTN